MVWSVLLHVTYNKVQDDSNQSYPLTASCLEMSQSEDGARHSLAETQRVPVQPLETSRGQQELDRWRCWTVGPDFLWSCSSFLLI